MPETFEKRRGTYDRLGCITPKVKFQVFEGGQHIARQPYAAISETTANRVHNVTVPSLEDHQSQRGNLEINRYIDDI